MIEIMPVQYLSDSNFSAPGGRSMRINIPGLVFVMFMTPSCPHCKKLQPLMEELSRRELRVKFAYANVGQFRRITGMSQTTNTPIKVVPTLMLYNNSNPFARYKGKQDIQSIAAFLNQMVNKLGASRPDTFISQPQRQPQHPQAGVGNNQLPGGISFTEAERQRQNQMEAKFVNDNEIPYNAPYMKYKPIDINYN